MHVGIRKSKITSLGFISPTKYAGNVYKKL